MTTATNASSVIVAGAEELASFAPIVPGQVKAYPVAKRPGITLICLTFDADAVLPEHIAKGPITLHTVMGEVKVEAEGQEVALGVGGVMHIDTRVEHALRAPVRARVLLTLFEGSGAGEPEVPGIIQKAANGVAQSDEGSNLIPVTDVSDQGSADADHDGGCGCGEEDEALPELDVRPIPHAIRHATVFGALQGLQPQKAMVLLAHHNPVPLLRQIEQMFSGGIEITYLTEGPEVWRLRMYRKA